MRTRRPRRADRERGAVLIELTLITPFLIVLVMGMLELGIAWRDSVTVTQASRQGARVGSHLGDEALSDQQLVQSTVTVLQPEQGRIDYIVVYRADGTGDVPASCLPTAAGIPSTFSQAGLCNVYGQAEIADMGDPAEWGCGASPSGGTRADDAWCPTSRNALTEYLGVHVQFDRPRSTGIFGSGSYKLSANTVMRIEPEYG